MGLSDCLVHDFSDFLDLSYLRKIASSLRWYRYSYVTKFPIEVPAAVFPSRRISHEDFDLQYDGA